MPAHDLARETQPDAGAFAGLELGTCFGLVSGVKGIISMASLIKPPTVRIASMERRHMIFQISKKRSITGITSGLFFRITV